jgi:hypothetical protein
MINFFTKYGIPDINTEYLSKCDIEAVDYLFLGNICDFGRYSLEVICTLFSLKLKYPKSIHILRGSHEDIHINKE